MRKVMRISQGRALYEVRVVRSEILLSGMFVERDELGMRKNYEIIPLRSQKLRFF